MDVYEEVCHSNLLIINIFIESNLKIPSIEDSLYKVSQYTTKMDHFSAVKKTIIMENYFKI